jgi:DNA polymerase/3'-5' exonuclease PolX
MVSACSKVLCFPSLQTRRDLRSRRAKAGEHIKKTIIGLSKAMTMDYQEALTKALKYKAALSPFCEVIEIAGSVRRKKSTDIKDVELVCIPKLKPILDMFNLDNGAESLLETNLPEILASWNAWPIKNGEKYKQVLFSDGTKLDLFIVTPETWGVQFAIRTGPADYSQWLVTKRNGGGALPSFAQVKHGRVWVHGEAIQTPREIDFFNFLQIPMPEPENRVIQKKEYAA